MATNYISDLNGQEILVHLLTGEAIPGKLVQGQAEAPTPYITVDLGDDGDVRDLGDDGDVRFIPWSAISWISPAAARIGGPVIDSWVHDEG